MSSPTLLSRKNQVIGSEWTLCAEAFRHLLRLWPATIDLFATSLNHRLPVYFSLMVDPQSAGTDAMLQSWDGLQAYAFPPFGLLSLILIAPFCLSILGSWTFWSFWWRFPPSCHNGGIFSNSPTSIIFIRTSPCFS